MSQENVELVRGIYKRWEAGDLALDAMGPDFVYDASNVDGWVGSSVYVGPDGLREFMIDWTSSWQTWGIRVSRLLDAGQDQVVAHVLQRGTGKGSGATVENRFGQVWTVRNGKPTRLANFTTFDQALEAVGLSVQDAHADS